MAGSGEIISITSQVRICNRNRRPNTENRIPSSKTMRSREKEKGNESLKPSETIDYRAAEI